MLEEKVMKSLDEIVNLSKSNHYKINSITLYNFYTDIVKGQPDVEVMEDMNNYIMEAGIEIITDGVEIDDESNDFSKYEIQPFDPSQINIESKPLLLVSLIERIENDEVNLNTDFQRKAGLWTNVQKSQLIESLLLKIPLPAFYFDAGNDDNWLIIDGLQRITAIKEFIVDKTLALTGLEFFSDLNGKKFNDLPRSFVRRIKEAEIVTYRIKAGTPANVKYNIFKRINTGGLELTSQEIRHALYQGQASQFLIKLANTTEFTSATSNSIRKDRMLDREFVLRYIGVCYFGVENYQGIPDEFLNSTMEYLNSISPNTLDKIEYSFLKTMRSSHQILGKHAFRKIAEDMRRRPINKAIYEMWCYGLNDLSESELKKLKHSKNALINNFMQLCSTDSFLQLIKSSDRSSYLKRITMGNELIRRYL